MKRLLQKIHLTYEQMGDSYPAEEYKRAISALLVGADPTVQMSPSAQEIYNTIPLRTSIAMLQDEGRNIVDSAAHLSATLRKLQGPISAQHVASVCNLVISAALYYEKPHTSRTERMLLGRSVTTTLLVLLRLAQERESFVSSVISLQKHTQSIHVAAPESPEYEEAVSNVIYLKDYVECHEDSDRTD